MKLQYVGTLLHPTRASHFPLASLTYKTSMRNKYVIYMWQVSSSQNTASTIF